MPYVIFLSSYFFFSRMHVSYFVCVSANSIKKQLQKKKKKKKKIIINIRKEQVEQRNYNVPSGTIAPVSTGI